MNEAATGHGKGPKSTPIVSNGNISSDTGYGISEQEREAVLRRFYRSDKIRNTPGVGLGLSLVAAIVRLHGFRLAIHPGPGGRMEIICPDH